MVEGWGKPIWPTPLVAIIAGGLVLSLSLGSR